MLPFLIAFIDLLLAALVAGALFGIWLFLNPTGLDAQSYVTVQQQAIRTLNNVMPPVGAATILVTIIAGILGRGDGARILLLTAAGCFAATGLITRFRNQPINAIVMTWHAEMPPPTWTQLRDQWWRWHLVRVAMGLLGLCLIITATLKRG